MTHEQHDDEVTNRSGNRPFEAVLKARHSRRAALKGGMTAAAVTFLAPQVAGARRYANKEPLIGFEPVALVDGNGPSPAISPDYEYQVLIAWGTPLQPGGPQFSYPPSAEEQAQQIGIGHDGMWFFPKWERKRWRWKPSSTRGYLCINHEFGTNSHVLGKPAPESLEDVRVSQHAHGVAVVEIEKQGEQWAPVKSHLSRRIHVNTPVSFSGPAAGSPLLETPQGNPTLGTVNNCSSGPTPWGTYLTCEENFNGYFGATGEWTPTEAQARYGLSAGGFGYGWEKFDPRFDLSNDGFVNEDNRFGWVVEIDPRRPQRAPVKRTALGRLKHEGATVVTGRGGKAVVYMGDDQRFDYIYKFVSAHSWRSMIARGRSPLDEGTLYVARFLEDGTGEWLALDMDNPDLKGDFFDQADIVTNARLAADKVGATPMDRPEWITVAPDATVYCTLTNNSRRATPDAANPQAPNPDGHIIRWRDSHDHVGTEFEWDIWIFAADTHGTEDSFSDPDGLWADPDGRIFIETDGGQKDGLNNQLLVADPSTGDIRRLFTGVTGDEITGLTVTPDRRTLFINTQHPGKGDPRLTNFPAPRDGVTVPRDCTFAIRRKDGGIVGS